MRKQRLSEKPEITYQDAVHDESHLEKPSVSRKRPDY